MWSKAQWHAKASAHKERVQMALADVIWRRDRGRKHPVDDFLFHYYNLRPSHLGQWHPGVGQLVEDDGSWQAPRYLVKDGAARLDVGHFLQHRGQSVKTAAELLRAAFGKPPRFGCFGMHEWAMVYRLAQGETRHPYLPLRLPPDRIAEVVEQVGCRCSHYDAFRFFTTDARPLNLITPTRQTQSSYDQPGCIHVTMDLYKWAGKLWPAVSSELLWATFELAREARAIDMRASAYDLAEWGYEPIAVETSEGRREYVQAQRELAGRAAPLRAALLAVIDDLCLTRQESSTPTSW